MEIQLYAFMELSRNEYKVYDMSYRCRTFLLF